MRQPSRGDRGRFSASRTSASRYGTGQYGGPRPRSTGGRGCLSGCLVSLLIGFALAAVAIVAIVHLVSVTSPRDSAQLERVHTSPTLPDLDFSGFDASHIISDAVMHQTDAMSDGDIRAFIEQWNQGCEEGIDGTPCLADYRADTESQPADQYCPAGYQGAPGEDAAQILWKTTQGCGINPQVLLVMLQKEQGLISASGSGLTDSRYGIAMGYACPDGTTCDPQYFGFQRQVWFAARQIKKYEASPWDFRVVPGVARPVRFGPEEGCDGSDLTVHNQATADLYNYTPYQPDEARLAGASSNCSGQGNLNFYAYFKAWFGDPRG